MSLSHAAAAIMQTSPAKPKSAYLNSAPRTLYDVCRTMGRDDDGRACAACPLRGLCVAQLLRAGRRHDGSIAAARIDELQEIPSRRFGRM
jgi:hypothetical protein